MGSEVMSGHAARVLITGASGFLGQALVQHVTDSASMVTAVSRRKSLSTSANWIAVNDYMELQPLLTQQHCVVHLAARVHVMDDFASDPLAEFRAANVETTMKLATLAARSGVRRFIFISSVKVNGESTQAGHMFTENDTPSPQDAYGQSKYEAECGLRQIAEASGMEVVIIRSPLVYGPGVKANFAALMRAVQRGWPLPLGAVHNRRSLVFLDNLVDFIEVCISHPQAANQTFLVSDGHDLSTPDLVRGLARAGGVTGRLIPVPVWALRAGAALVGKSSAIERLCGSLQVDISKARSLLGWTPPVSVERGLFSAVSGKGVPGV